MSETQPIHVDEISQQMHSQRLKRADALACSRLTGQPIWQAAKVLVDLGINGDTIFAQQGDKMWDDEKHRFSRRPRIKAAEEILVNFINSK